MAIKYSPQNVSKVGDEIASLGTRYFFAGKQTVEQGLYALVTEGEVTGLFTRESCVTST